MDLSISIVNWNTREILAKCLESVFTQLGEDVSGEVIVVDNASTDKSAEMVRELFPAVLLIANSTNVGFATANNQALSLSQGKYFLFLNSDTLLTNGCLRSLVNFMESHPDVGAAGPKLLYGDGLLQLSAAQFPRPSTAFWGGVFLNQMVNRFFPKVKLKRIQYGLLPEEHDLITEVDWVIGACIITRCEALKKIGGMDNNIFFYYEEADLCYRLKQAGWKIFLFPQATVIHYQGVSYAGIWDQKEQVSRQLSSLEYFYRKNYGQSSLLSFRILTISGSILKMIAAAILSLTGKKRRQLLKEKFFWQWHTLTWYMSKLKPAKTRLENEIK